MPTRAPTRVGFQAVDPVRGGTTALLEGGFPVEPEEVDAFVAEVARRLPGVDLALIGGSVPDPAADDLVRRCLDLCTAAGVPCWVDSYGPAMDRALAAARPPRVVKPNREEFGSGRGWRACPEIHVTDGPNPILVHLPGRRLRVRPPAVREVNPIGSGDSYVAGLAHARLSGWPLEEQLSYAAAAGAANAARADVARVGPEDIRALSPGVCVEEDG